MNILLDECIDRRLARELSGHRVRTVPQMNWATIKNGKLLKLAEQVFDVFVTVDRNLSFQQPLPKFGLAVVVCVPSPTVWLIFDLWLPSCSPHYPDSSRVSFVSSSSSNHLEKKTSDCRRGGNESPRVKRSISPRYRPAQREERFRAASLNWSRIQRYSPRGTTNASRRQPQPR